MVLRGSSLVQHPHSFSAPLSLPDWQNGAIYLHADDRQLHLFSTELVAAGGYLSLRSRNRVARHTHLLWTLTNKLSSLLDLDRLRRDWWLWLESWISETAYSPLTIFYKLLPLVNLVAPTPSVSVRGGRNTHTHHDHSFKTRAEKRLALGLFRGVQQDYADTFADRYLSVSGEGQWQGASDCLLQGSLCYFY